MGIQDRGRNGRIRKEKGVRDEKKKNQKKEKQERECKGRKEIEETYNDIS